MSALLFNKFRQNCHIGRVTIKVHRYISIFFLIISTKGMNFNSLTSLQLEEARHRYCFSSVVYGDLNFYRISWFTSFTQELLGLDS